MPTENERNEKTDMKKVILILVDGMRPDSLALCGNKYVDELLENSAYTLSAKTVMPSVTLPCHMSLFHGVDPERHGILTNTYVPQVRPVKGLCEVLRSAGKKCAFFYNWEELRDLTRPDSLAYSDFVSGHVYSYEKAIEICTDNCIEYIKKDSPDFAFLYLGWTDEAGHGYGWMGDEYLRSVRGSFDCIERVVKSLDDDYVAIITADHGGHGRCHGTDMPEDMNIPVIITGNSVEKQELENVKITDITSTVTAFLEVAPDPEWEGRNLI